MEGLFKETVALKVEVEVAGKKFQVEVVSSEDPGESSFACTVEGDQTTHHIPLNIISRRNGSWAVETDQHIEVFEIRANHQETRIDWNNRAFKLQVSDQRELLLKAQKGLDTAGLLKVKSLMPGKVIQVSKGVGDPVEAGEGLVVIEAMKMQNEIKSPKAGTVVACKVTQGCNVNAGEVLFEIE